MALPTDYRPSRRLAVWLATALLTACSALAILQSAPARAVIKTYEGQRFGLQERALLPKEEPAQRAALKYHGGSILPESNTYAIYWDPIGSYRPDWMRLIDGYFHNVGADSGKLSNVFSLTSQYTGPASTRAAYQNTFRGAYTDTTPYGSSECKTTPELPVCLTDRQIHNELFSFIQANNLPMSLDVVYVVLTPPGVRVCTVEKDENACSNSTTVGGQTNVEEANGFCSYHSFLKPSPSQQVVYAVQPWIAGDAGHVVKYIPVKTENTTPEVLACQNREALVEPHQVDSYVNEFENYETGLADIIINDLSIEQEDVVTDPLLNGWSQTGTEYEQSDMCQRVFGVPGEKLPEVPETTHALPISNESIGGDNYYLQWSFSSVGVTSGKGVTCWQATLLDPHFTSPNPVNVENIVAFDANESKMALEADLANTASDEPFTAPIYTWNFGDGSPIVSGPAEASVFHYYRKPGKYTVTLLVTDSAGNQASFAKAVDVLGETPASPGAELPPVSPPAPTPAAPTAPAGSPPSGAVASPAPKVFAKVASYSLKKALRFGLAVSYYANEQVAGGLEAMISSKVAKRLHLKGPAAKGLPKGYPKQVVLGDSVLITTTAGHGLMRVKFSRQLAQRLASVHKLRLTLRIVVRNADRAHPKTTTLLSVVVLKG